jgi:hypothetical protein
MSKLQRERKGNLTKREKEGGWKEKARVGGPQNSSRLYGCSASIKANIKLESRFKTIPQNHILSSGLEIGHTLPEALEHSRHATSGIFLSLTFPYHLSISCHNINSSYSLLIIHPMIHSLPPNQPTFSQLHLHL